MRDHFHPGTTGKRSQGRSMQGYDHSTPRAALGLTAVVMATITMSAMVVLPAKFDAIPTDSTLLATAKTATEAPIAVDGSQACVDTSEAVNRQVDLLADRAARAPRESLGNHKLSLRSISSI